MSFHRSGRVALLGVVGVLAMSAPAAAQKIEYVGKVNTVLDAELVRATVRGHAPELVRAAEYMFGGGVGAGGLFVLEEALRTTAQGTVVNGPTVDYLIARFTD